MEDLKKIKLIHKLLGFVLPLVILSIVITSAVLSWTNYTYFQKTITQDYRNILKRSGGEISFFMANAQNAIARLALIISATKLDQWQKEMALTAFHHNAAEFIYISLIGREGKKIATAGHECPEDFQKDITFNRALKGQKAISGALRTEGDIPHVHIAAPVLRLGEVKEVLWGELNLKSVWDVLEGITIGHTGHVYILDLSGRYIGHREIDRVFATPPPERTDLLRKLRESDAPIEWMEEENDTEFYCMGYRIPDLNWIVVLSQPRPEIYAYIYKNIYWALLITCVICAAAIVLGWRQVRHFLAPVHILHRHVQRIGEGDLDHLAPIVSKDEIGDLAMAFNRMTDSLKKFISREVKTATELVHAKNLAILDSASSKVTHEVGNLLNNVGLVLSILKRETLSPGGEKAREILEKDSMRIREFITNFLQFTKKPELRLERQAMDIIIREVLFVYKPEAEKKGILLELDWPSALPPITIDARLMCQVFDNLVKNGLEAMNEPGKMSVAGDIERERLVVTISDTGPGIEPDVRERIFEPFFTTKGKKGAGLGLAIVKTIVESHRGDIECRSEVNKGTTFVVRLPLQ